MASNDSLKWVYSLGKLVGDEVVLLGAQRADFIEALQSVYPELDINVFDTQAPAARVNSAKVRYHYANTMNELLSSELYQIVLKHKPLVLTNRQSWIAREAEMTDYFACLTGRSKESLHYHLIELGIDVKAISIGGHLASIKDVLNAAKGSNSEKKPSLLVMQELIK